MNLSEYDFHHLGYAVNSVEGISRKMEILGWKSGDIFEDENQGIRGVFLEGAGPRMELLENMRGVSTLDQFLKSGDFVFYHMGYFTDDMDISVTQSREAGGKQIAPPLPAVAFGGRKICFFAFRGMILEWIESGAK